MNTNCLTKLDNYHKSFTYICYWNSFFRLFEVYYPNLLYHFFNHLTLQKKTKIIVADIVKCNWNESTLFLCDKSFTFAMSWSSIRICSITMISFLIRKFLLLTISTNIIISMVIFIFLGHYIIFPSVFQIEGPLIL